MGGLAFVCISFMAGGMDGWMDGWEGWAWLTELTRGRVCLLFEGQGREVGWGQDEEKSTLVRRCTEVDLKCCGRCYTANLGLGVERPGRDEKD